MQQDVESAGDECGYHGGRSPVRDVGRGADVRGVRQPNGQTSGPDGQGADVLASSRGQRPAAGMAAGAQLRLVHGRGAARRVRDRPEERGHGAVLRGVGRGRSRRRRPPETCRRRCRGRRRVRRVLRARVQRPVLRRFRGGRARAVHAQRRLLSAGRLLGRCARRIDGHKRTPLPPWPPVCRSLRSVRRHCGRLRAADSAPESRLARRRVSLPIRRTSQPAKM